MLGSRALEQYLQAELHEPWVRSRRGRRYHPKIFVVRRATYGVGWRKLGSIENIEEFRSQFQGQPLVPRESGSFEDREIKISNSLRP
jgi:hypothetical protein